MTAYTLTFTIIGGLLIGISVPRSEYQWRLILACIGVVLIAGANAS